jgi:Holliday junction resolvase RusA-like endonuclease
VKPLGFFVAGQPGTKGSARAFVRGGRAIITNDAGEKAKCWAAKVTDAAREAMAGAAPFDGPVVVGIVFHLPRPQSHYLRGQLRASAPIYVTTKPDGDKLVRCSWDALTGVVFTDDSRIVEWSGSKVYSDAGRVGAAFSIRIVA